MQQHPQYLLFALLGVLAAPSVVLQTVLYGSRTPATGRGAVRNGLRPPPAAYCSAAAAARGPAAVRRRLPGDVQRGRRRLRPGFLLVLLVGKMLATSLTIGIGGSGGVFAPSLFIGAMAGMAYGVIARHLFGPVAGPPALYAVVAMGAVFTAAARAPLTSLASVVEMTGDFALTFPVMLAVAIAAEFHAACLTAPSTPPSCCAAAPTSTGPLRGVPARPQGRRRHAPLPEPVAVDDKPTAPMGRCHRPVAGGGDS